MKTGLIMLAILLFVWACQPQDGQKTFSTTQNSVVVPRFSADSAFTFIEAQVNFGPRVPDTPPHKACGRWLAEKLRNYGASVVTQSFEAAAYNGKVLQLENIIATFYPDRKKRILLAAHYDTRPFADKDTVRINEPIAGANDGGSGVAVLLEVARQLQKEAPQTAGVDIIFFDGEDYGQPSWDETPVANINNTWCLGSQYWAANKHLSNYTAYYGILLDMVGGKGATFEKEGFSMEYAPVVVEKVWKAAENAGYSDFFLPYKTGYVTDDHYYVNQLAKIPMVNIIEFSRENSFGAYHHTHADDLSNIDKTTLQAVGQTVLEVIYQD